MYILGISAYYHDSAAALLKNGEVIAAAQEERFTRKRHDHDFPINATKYCLKEAGIDIDKVDYISFYDKPFIKFERIMYTYLATFPRSFPSFIKAIPMWLHQKLWIPHNIRKQLNYGGKVLFTEHHQSHAASAFLVSPHDEAAILTLDGVGEWATAAIGHGEGNNIRIIQEINFPHSLGLLYSAFTYFLGFKVNSAEYKVMGLAPYGKPEYVDLIKENLIAVNEDGSFRMNMKYFAFDYGLTMTNKNMEKLFGIKVRKSESPLEQIHKDIAASVQKVTEEIVLKMCHKAYDLTKSKNLCMAGGVALNCVANGRVIKETPFENVYIQPAAGDAGGAMGTAAFVYHCLLKKERNTPLKHAYLGPEFSNEEIETYLNKYDIKHKNLSDPELVRETAKLIDGQKVVGWFQGRMEFGPRSLGARSILADARNPENKDVVNMKIKFRESFRPFAPAILEEKVSEYFELDRESPYMLLVAQVRKEKRTIPSVTHVDGSARIQTVSKKTNPLFHDLLAAFDKLTGCPVIINTSFNVRGEPIVCTPEEAYVCFMRTNMDFLVMGNYLLDKKDMKPLGDDIDWQKEFELD